MKATSFSDFWEIASVLVFEWNNGFNRYAHLLTAHDKNRRLKIVVISRCTYRHLLKLYSPQLWTISRQSSNNGLNV